MPNARSISAVPTRRCTLLMLTAVAMAACTSDEQAARESVIGEPLEQSLERAREVEDVLERSAEERNRQLEQALE